jgi:hypothetical protein
VLVDTDNEKRPENGPTAGGALQDLIQACEFLPSDEVVGGSKAASSGDNCFSTLLEEASRSSSDGDVVVAGGEEENKRGCEHLVLPKSETIAPDHQSKTDRLRAKLAAALALQTSSPNSSNFPTTSAPCVTKEGNKNPSSESGLVAEESETSFLAAESRECSVTTTDGLGQICLTNRKKCSILQCFRIPFKPLVGPKMAKTVSCSNTTRERTK